MKIECSETDDGYLISLEPEGVKDTAFLVRMAMQGETPAVRVTASAYQDGSFGGQIEIKKRRQR